MSKARSDDSSTPAQRSPDEFGEAPTRPAPEVTPNFEPKHETQGYVSAAADSPAPAASGTFHGPRVPGYEILGVLGRGGMGVVYKARQLGLNRLAALKMILAGGHAGPEQRARFHTEAEAVARLRHPNIVQVYEVGEHDGLPFLALEYVEGGTLRGALAGTPQSARTAASLLATLTRAMGSAHRSGVVHRDLKPANVLLQRAEGHAHPDGAPATSDVKGGTGSASSGDLGSVIPKISDFGLAKRLDEDSGQTQTGQILGTPSYMAPEQAAGRVHEIGPAADLYALGAILYELLTGRPPFKGATPRETIEQVCVREPVPPAQLRPGVPRDLETICLKCLRKEPARRYDTAEALADDLQRFLEGRPILARPAGLPERLWRWCLRNRAVASLAALTLTFLLVTIGVLLGAYVATRDALASETEALGAKTEALAAAQQARMNEVQQRKAAETEREKAEKRRAEAVTERERADLERARARAEEQRAQEARRAAEERLVRLTVANGTRRWDEGDPAGAALHFLAALELDPEHAATHQQRLGLALDDCARPVQLGFHAGPIAQLAFSPDGRRLASAGADGVARVWSVPAGEPVARLIHAAPVRHVVFHPTDPKRLLTASHAGVVQAWDITTGQPAGPRFDLRHTPYHAAYSPDGQLVIAVGGDRYSLPQPGTAPRTIFQGVGKPPLVLPGQPLRNPLGRAQFWDAATGEARGKLGVVGWFNMAVFAPTGDRIATAGAKGTQGLSAPGSVRIWDRAGKPLTPPLMHRDEVRVVAFSPDGARLVTASGHPLGGRGEARLWDARNGTPLGRPLPHERAVISAAFSPEGTRVLTASTDGSARVWDGLTGVPISPSLRHGDALTAALFSPDGGRVLTAGTDGMARVWDAKSGEPLGPWLVHDGSVEAIAFAPDGRHLATGGADGVLRLWDLAAGRALPRQFRSIGAALDARLAPDGRILAASLGQPSSVVTTYHGGLGVARTVFTRETLALWDVTTGKPLPTLPSQLTLVPTTFHPDSKQLATLTPESSQRASSAVQLWNLPAATPAGAPFASPGLRWAGFTDDGRCLAISVVSVANPANPKNRRATLRVWDVRRAAPLSPPLDHTAEVIPAGVSADGKLLVLLEGQHVRLRHLPGGEERGEPQAVDMSVGAILHSDGRRLLLVGRDRIGVRLVDLDRRTTTRIGEREPIEHAALSTDGRRVATAGADGSARVWDAATGQPLTPPLRHQRAVRHVAFSGDGKLLATASADRTARLWDAATGEPLSAPLRHRAEVGSVAFTAAGDRLVTAASDGTVTLWNLPRETRTAAALASLVRLLAGRRLDPTGGLAPVPAKALAAAHQATAAADLACPPERVAAWYRLQAEQAERGEQWHAAVVLLSPLIVAEPKSSEWHIRRGRAHAELEQWASASADFGAALRLGSVDENVRRGAALANLAAGRADDYRAALRTLWTRREAIDPKALARRARASVLTADALPDFTPLATATADMKLGIARAGDLFDVHAAALFRAGRPAEAIVRLTANKSRVTENPWTWLLLALAHHRQGRTDEAKAALRQAADWLDAPPESHVDVRGRLLPFAWSRLTWEDRLALRLLRREAETALRGGQRPANPDPRDTGRGS